MTFLKKIGSQIINSKAFIMVSLFALFLFIPSVFFQTNTQQPDVHEQEILGVTSKRTIPTPTVTPTPTLVLTPSKTPSPTPTPTPQLLTPTPTQAPASNSSQPTNSPTPTPTPTLTPSPVPAGLAIRIGVDYADQKSSDSYTLSLNPGQKAWDAVVQAVGINNIQYDQYDFGKFITGLNGISADPNSQYYEFRVNGASSSVGVSDYSLNDGDVLDFVLTTF